MKKIFTYYANNGDWNGYHTEYVIVSKCITFHTLPWIYMEHGASENIFYL